MNDRENIRALPEQYIVAFTIKDKPYSYHINFYPSNVDSLPRMASDFVEQLESEGEEVIDYRIGVFRPLMSKGLEEDDGKKYEFVQWAAEMERLLESQKVA